MLKSSRFSTLASRYTSTLIRSESANLPSKIRLPSTDDYTKILKKLDIVISNANCGQKLLILSPETPLNIFLEKGASQCIHIYTSGQPPPLHIKIQRHYGRVRCYMSRKIAEPTEEINDECSTNDLIEISDPNPAFKLQRVALCVKSMSDSHFLMSIKYGGPSTKNKPLDNETNFKYYGRSKFFLEEDSLDMKIKEAKDEQQKKWKKRYRSYNNLTQSRGELDRIKVHTRRMINYNRSKVLYEKLILRKKEIMDSGRKSGFRGAGDIEKGRARIVLTFMCFVRTAGLISGLINRKKEEFVKKQELTPFKMVYKMWSGIMSAHVCLELSRVSLLSYRNLLRGYHRINAKKRLKKAFHNIFIIAKAIRRFDIFADKCKFIQHEWKRYKNVKDYRIIKIEKIWRAVVKKIKQKITPKAKVNLDIAKDQLKKILAKYYLNYMKYYRKADHKPKSLNLLYSSNRIFKFMSDSYILNA